MRPEVEKSPIALIALSRTVASDSVWKILIHIIKVVFRETTNEALYSTIEPCG